MPISAHRPKNARVVRSRPVFYLGQRIQYAELRSGSQVISRVPLTKGGTSFSEARERLRKEARQKGYVLRSST